MVSTGMWKTAANTAAATTAVRDSGMPRCSRGRPTMSSATRPTIPRVRPAAVQSGWVMIVHAASSVRWPSGAVTPNAAGTCCKKMMAAIPRVKPSITGQGMNVTARPRPVIPAATTSTPASTVTRAMLPAPCSETIGASTTAIAPVGPET